MGDGVPNWARTARRLAYFTIAYNLLEAGVAAAFGVKDSSLSLLGFGADSLLEAASGGVVLWRFAREGAFSPGSEALEHRAHRLIGALLLSLAGILALGALGSLARGHRPGSGLPGTVLSLVSLAVMAWLYRAKSRAAAALDSAVLRADAFCTKSCLWLGAVLLGGSLLLTATHQGWFDAAASLGMAWLVGREGWENWHGEGLCRDAACDGSGATR